jgi:predicted Zn-dependent protease
MSDVNQQAAPTLLNRQNSREAASAADSFAIQPMQAVGRPISSLGKILDRMAGHDGGGINLLRDHPVTSERVQRRKDAQRPASGPVLLSGDEWLALGRICR